MSRTGPSKRCVSTSRVISLVFGPAEDAKRIGSASGWLATRMKDGVLSTTKYCRPRTMLEGRLSPKKQMES